MNARDSQSMREAAANKCRLVNELAGGNPLAARELRLLLKMDRRDYPREARRTGPALY